MEDILAGDWGTSSFGAFLTYSTGADTDAARAVDALLDGERAEAVCLSARLTPEFIRQSLATQQAEADRVVLPEAAPAPDSNEHTHPDTGSGEDAATVQD